MFKRVTCVFSALSLIMTPVVGYGTQVTSGGSSGSSGVESGGTVVGTQGAQPSVKDGSDKSKSGNGMAQALNYIVGGSEVVMGYNLIQEGTSCSPSPCSALIAMGVMMVGMGLTNIAQGSEHGSAAGSAGVTGFQTDGFGGLTNPDYGNGSNPYVQTAIKDPNYRAVGSTLKKLEQSGVYNPKLGTFAVGDKTYKQSDFASKDSMASAGLPPGAIDGALAANADAEKKALAKLEKVKVGAATAENGYSEGGGGGGAGGFGAGGSDDGSSVAGIGGAGSRYGKTGLERDPSSLAGMTKNFNGEPIGVAADSIFLMMTRRYKVKESQDSFFSPADLALQK